MKQTASARAFIRRFNAVAEGYNQAAAAFGGRIRKARAITSTTLTQAHRAKIAESVRLSWIERKAVAA